MVSKIILKESERISRILYRKNLPGRTGHIIGFDIGTSPIGKVISKGDDPIYEIGAGIISEGGEDKVKQFRSDEQDFSGERRIIEYFIEWLDKFPIGSTLVTYNGKNYDIPVLLMRSWNHKIKMGKTLRKFIHFDVFQFLKRMKEKGKLKNIKSTMKLESLEKLFGFERTAHTRYYGKLYLREDVMGLLKITKGIVGG